MAGIKLDLTNRRTFCQTVKAATKQALGAYYGGRFSPNLSIGTTVYDNQLALREYSNLGRLRLAPEPGEIFRVPATLLESAFSYQSAVRNLLAGSVITEHSAGGEAIRLGLGSKFLLTPNKLGTALANDLALSARITTDPAKLIPLSFGLRHMAQFAYDLTDLAAKNRLNTREVLQSQFMIITLNPKTADEIISQFVRFNFFGFNPERLLFMEDVLYHGMHITEAGEIEFAPRSDIRLYNHGHMVMQEAMERELFTVYADTATGEINHKPLSRLEVENILEKMEAKVSYPIEDNDYLTSSLNIISLATAIELGARDYRMVMEVLGQSDPPQKGGGWAFDPVLGRGVMIESDSGGSIITENNIVALNRNFNVFPRPASVFRKLANSGLPYLHLMVTEGHLYLQPPQGDLNFLVPTAFVQREGAGPINALKKLTDGPKTLSAMAEQDAQYGFEGFLREHGLIGARLDPKDL